MGKHYFKKCIGTICSLCLITCFLTGQALAAPSVTGGFAGISKYSKCGYGDRAGRQYVNNFSTGLQVIEELDQTINYTEKYQLTDSDVTTESIADASRVTFFAYAGHGLNYDATNNALHVNASTSGLVSHSSLGEKNTSINLKTTDTLFPHKYVVLYSCNQLTNGNSTTKADNILEMMDGTRLMMGFASTMYLDSREASRFVAEMRYMTIADAYISAAEYYQVQRADADSIARVVGYIPAEDDELAVAESYAPTGDLSDFDIITTVKIPRN